MGVERESNAFLKEYTGNVYIFKGEGYNQTQNNHENFDYSTKTSLQLIAKVDIIRFFKEKSRHALKIGGGGGIIYYQDAWSKDDFKENSDLEYNLSVENRRRMLGSFKASYEYRITPKFSVGTYVGRAFHPTLGLLIRGN